MTTALPTPPRPVREPDWTNGPAKFVAVALLGVVCVVGLSWSILGKRTRPELSRPAPVPAAVVGNAAAPPEKPPAASIAKRINLNTAASAELQMLPGIGPALAARIIEDRERSGPFRSVDELDRVRGIGPKTIDKLRDLACVE